MSREPFFSGVIEGFYGPPWNVEERATLLDWLEAWQLDSYIYAPKDDLKHRILWRELLDEREAAALKLLLAQCRGRGLRLVYALAPGLDMVYARPQDYARLRAKLAQVAELGVRSFALCFDDIPQRMHPSDQRRFGSLAAAQAFVSNRIYDFLRELKAGSTLWFCPTAYCKMLADQWPDGWRYLEAIGGALHPSLEIFWTGPAIISAAISPAGIQEVGRLLQRKPLLWDNLHANDYDRRRLYLGPYAGRPRRLRERVRGILLNPNVQFEANFVAIKTLAEYLQRPGVWRPREAFQRSLRAWLSRFGSSQKNKINLGDLETIGDLFYLPHEMGPRAKRFLRRADRLLGEDSPGQSEVRQFAAECQQLMAFYDKFAGLTNRRLWTALQPFLWDVREEISLLLEAVQWRSQPGRSEAFVSKNLSHPVYRGGFIAALHQRLGIDPNGRIHPQPWSRKFPGKRRNQRTR